MTPFRMLGAAVIVFASLVTDEAIARTPYDGYWSVVIYTQRGACQPAYRSGVSIVNGYVRGGGGMASVYGRVNRRGAVSVVVQSGAQSARGSGRLGRRAGSGRWSGRGTAGRCSGRWVAQRR